MNLTLESYEQALNQKQAQQQRRSLRQFEIAGPASVRLDGKELVNFASNDYLALSQSPALIERSVEYTKRYGVGNGASRLLSGNLSVFDSIEKKLAQLKGSQAALILPSGYQANCSVIPSLLSKRALAAADKLVHRSMIEGLKAASAKYFRFQHLDYQQLEKRLTKTEPELLSNAWLFTESVFSMDGDRVTMGHLIGLQKKFDLSLYIDEAHATGVLGENGMGLTAGLGFKGISMGTFGKGLGSFGAYICCSTLLRDYLINFCPGLIYSTALPPPVLGAIDAALDLIPEMENERRQLLSNAEYFRSSLKKFGFETLNSSTQIVPLVLGSSQQALLLSDYLEQVGFYVPAIRPPTVKEGSARLRVSLSLLHTKEQIDKLLNALRNWYEKKR